MRRSRRLMRFPASNTPFSATCRTHSSTFSGLPFRARRTRARHTVFLFCLPEYRTASFSSHYHYETLQAMSLLEGSLQRNL